MFQPDDVTNRLAAYFEAHPDQLAKVQSVFAHPQMQALAARFTAVVADVLPAIKCVLDEAGIDLPEIVAVMTSGSDVPTEAEVDAARQGIDDALAVLMAGPDFARPSVSPN